MLRLHYKEGTVISEKIESFASRSMVAKTWKDENMALYQEITNDGKICNVRNFITCHYCFCLKRDFGFNNWNNLATLHDWVLHILGLEKERIRKIFTTYGLLVSSLGLSLGVIFGMLLSISLLKSLVFGKLFGFDLSC